MTKLLLGLQQIPLLVFVLVILAIGMKHHRYALGAIIAAAVIVSIQAIW